ncbi:LOW QUALITY PROTEIN: hypothetical protein PHPALM_31106 [Phytophthora palmivora]|uniref:Uncharacterized protein n=1 Tax=Phytophthora palmivora TaxID=4796 RepID=A0A2P4X3E2_9STRA|nr:LOW QUALITY PROTEIN: hypothetical protein PHPALM_31106 [Phytophthora palmivora]
METEIYAAAQAFHTCANSPEDAAEAKVKFSAEVRAVIVEHGISEVSMLIKLNTFVPFVIFKSGASKHKHVQVVNGSIRHGSSVRLWKGIMCPSISTRLSKIWQPDRMVEIKHLLEYLEYHFGFRDDMEENCFLLWEDFSDHWTQMDYVASINVILLKVPPRYTYVCQPDDIARNQPCKSSLRVQWIQSLRTHIAVHHARDRDRREAQRELHKEIAKVARKEIQEGARMEIRCTEEKTTRSAFEMIASNRVDVASWIFESWSELTIINNNRRFANAGLLGDSRQFQDDQVLSDVEEITGLISQLDELGAIGTTASSDDECASSLGDD